LNKYNPKKEPITKKLNIYRTIEGSNAIKNITKPNIQPKGK